MKLRNYRPAEPLRADIELPWHAVCVLMLLVRLAEMWRPDFCKK